MGLLSGLVYSPYRSFYYGFKENGFGNDPQFFLNEYMLKEIFQPLNKENYYQTSINDEKKPLDNYQVLVKKILKGQYTPFELYMGEYFNLQDVEQNNIYETIYDTLTFLILLVEKECFTIEELDGVLSFINSMCMTLEDINISSEKIIETKIMWRNKIGNVNEKLNSLEIVPLNIKEEILEFCKNRTGSEPHDLFHFMTIFQIRYPNMDIMTPSFIEKNFNQKEDDLEQNIKFINCNLGPEILNYLTSENGFTLQEAIIILMRLRKINGKQINTDSMVSLFDLDGSEEVYIAMETLVNLLIDLQTKKDTKKNNSKIKKLSNH